MTENSQGAPLAGQVAVITGAGRGIGKAIALTLAQLGAHTVLCGRSRDALEQTSSEIASLAIQENSHRTSTGAADTATEKFATTSPKSSVIECDVSDLRSVDSLAERVARTFHRLDILVNNAALEGAPGPLLQLAPEIWDRVMNTNLRGVYYCIRSLAPIMVKARSGHIINISSLAGKNAFPNGAAYAASKWGLNGLSYSVAEELRAHNVRVSVICPGSTNTDFSLHPGKNEEKMLQASDVAHAVAMIVSQTPRSFVSEISIRPTQKP